MFSLYEIPDRGCWTFYHLEEKFNYAPQFIDDEMWCSNNDSRCQDYAAHPYYLDPFFAPDGIVFNGYCGYNKTGRKFTISVSIFYIDKSVF